jgi:hypothetical protein
MRDVLDVTLVGSGGVSGYFSGSMLFFFGGFSMEWLFDRRMDIVILSIIIRGLLFLFGHRW